jgi:NAD(P)H-hydrate epimerase
MLKKFEAIDLENLWKAEEDSSGEDNGQVMIIGGSRLFHGAPILAIKAASRLADMVFFGSPEVELEKITAKAALSSFIWVPWEEIELYIEKSDAVLIGPGFMRFSSEDLNPKSQISNHNQISNSNDSNRVFDNDGTLTKSVTKYLLQKFPEKRWVIDGGSLQVMEEAWIPENSILTPNNKELEILFEITNHKSQIPIKSQIQNSKLQTIELKAKEHHCVIVVKGPVGYVTDGETTYEIDGGNAGLTKGGTGDVLAGVTVGLLAKNPALLAAAAASYAVKKTAEKLFETVGHNFNADDVSERVFEVMNTSYIKI